MNNSPPKWLSKEFHASYHLFDHLVEIENLSKILCIRLITEMDTIEPDFTTTYECANAMKILFRLYNDTQEKNEKILHEMMNGIASRNPYKQLISKKLTIILHNLNCRQLHLLFTMDEKINTFLSAKEYIDDSLNIALTLISIQNECINLYNRRIYDGDNKKIGNRHVQICSNYFAFILLPKTKIDINNIITATAKNRSERCCSSLISCLLATCKLDATSDGNSDSDTSSIEILKALTTNSFQIADVTLKDPALSFFDKLVANEATLADASINAGNVNVDYLDKLVKCEENYFFNILVKCMRICPTVFDKSPSNEDLMKWVNKGTRSLWTLVAATMEHIILWWNNAPLACKSVSTIGHLRSWLLSMPFADAPEIIQSILHCLGESLTVHVTHTMWDKQFRLALVASHIQIEYVFERNEFAMKKSQLTDATPTGRLWSELLFTLTTLSNNCDQNSTIPKELPIVEQISVLHRLDHSIHSMRLWAAAQAKSLCTDWNMALFFRVVHSDLSECLKQISILRVPDLIPTDPYEVEVKVNVALRAKLVSEIKVNIQKLRLTYSECIDVMAAICKMLSLATLSLCFPKLKEWQCNTLRNTPSEYVNHFMEQIYLPVLRATQTLEILNLVLRIMCEAWLDHIYMKKIKFSREGALNLLQDFDGVSQWIINCNYVLPEHVEILSKHEVLRTCEGVGKILLRKPFESISMTSFTDKIKEHLEDKKDKEQTALLPPEMFVPNQQQWLQLRARKRNKFGINCTCCEEEKVLTK